MITLRTGYSRAAAAAVCLGFVVLFLFAAKWAFGHVTALGAETTEVANLGSVLAGRDPEASSAYATLLEKTMLPEDQFRALHERESATAFSPNNYVYWLALARSLEQAGEADRAEAAARRAAELAPNYSRVQWALGNILLRQGKRDEAFAEIRRAVSSDRSYAGPAAAAAWQIFQGEVPAVTNAVSASPRINAAFALLLASEKRFDEAGTIWRSIPAAEKPDLKDTGQTLYNKYLEGGKYRTALETATEVGVISSGEAAVDTVSNGGFESAIAPAAANAFSWSIAEGPFPRVGLSENQKHSGSYSLLLSFGQEGRGFRTVSQRVGVRAGLAYTLRFFYRSELKTEGKLEMRVFRPGSSDALGALAVASSPDWTEARVPFTVPAETEGVDVVIVLEGCPAEKCTVSGNIWFDDFELLIS